MPKTFYVGIKCIIIDNDKALLLKCKNRVDGSAYWDLPGGRMEGGESITDTLMRELKEEIPTIENIIIHDLLDAHRHPHTLPDGQELVLLMYKVSAHFPRIALSDEHCGYKWVRKDEIISAAQEAQLNPEYRNILDKML